jgi:hypothetical protein
VRYVIYIYIYDVSRLRVKGLILTVDTKTVNVVDYKYAKNSNLKF